MGAPREGVRPREASDGIDRNRGRIHEIEISGAARRDEYLPEEWRPAQIVEADARKTVRQRHRRRD
jgi:hypothetical protein